MLENPNPGILQQKVVVQFNESVTQVRSVSLRCVRYLDMHTYLAAFRFRVTYYLHLFCFDLKQDVRLSRDCVHY